MRDDTFKKIKRQRMKEAGALDGRYRQRTTRDKTKYSRKKKHKKDFNEGGLDRPF